MAVSTLHGRTVTGVNGLRHGRLETHTWGMAITVRVATVDDLSAFRFIGFSTWPQTYGPFAGARYVVEQLDRWWSADALSGPLEQGEGLIAMVGDEAVGVSQMAALGSDLVMWKLYVLPDRQGNGIGKMLLDTVKRVANQRHRPLITEYVAGNTQAGDFYRSQGFVDTSEPSDLLDSVWLRYACESSS